MRSQEKKFEYSQNCIFCGTGNNYDGCRKEHALIPVRSLEFKQQVLHASTSWPDEWRLKVKSRVDFVSDLPAADAVYHQVCNVNFRRGKQLPKKFVHEDSASKNVKLGRSLESLQTEVFKKIIEHVEEFDEEQITIDDLEQITIDDLVQNMDNHLNGTDT